MKTLLILILTVALLAAAYYTKPSPPQFKQFVVDQTTAQDKNFFSRGWDKMRAEGFVDSLQFQDHYLWTNVQQNGQTVYTGAFGHWFNRGQVDADFDTVKQDVSNVEQNLSNQIQSIRH
jgi:hypothetical protein